MSRRLFLRVEVGIVDSTAQGFVSWPAPSQPSTAPQGPGFGPQARSGRRLGAASTIERPAPDRTVCAAAQSGGPQSTRSAHSSRAIEGRESTLDRDRGAPRDATPPTPPGIRVPYRGGSIELGLGGRIDSGKTERLEVGVA